MRVRLTKKLNATLVQDQTATIIDYVFADSDKAGYRGTPAGTMFRPRYLPAGIWLQVDDFLQSPIPEEEALPLVGGDSSRARGLFLFEPVRQEFKWRSSETHTVTRTGFPLTHAQYLTSTASQGQTLRQGVTIDCGRMEAKGHTGMQDSEWWLHLYVMFSRATCMNDILVLRPPPRALLEGGPPASIRQALQRFESRCGESTDAAVRLAAEMGILIPA